ncbi:MAG: hypothetical protein AAFY38_15465 [Pseudomonadota bacterium]
MSIIVDQNVVIAAQVLDIVARERSQSLSRREWKHRLAGYGYTIRETAEGDYVESLPHRVHICAIPPDLSA